jgi:hypothetical protein
MSFRNLYIDPYVYTCYMSYNLWLWRYSDIQMNSQSAYMYFSKVINKMIDSLDVIHLIIFYLKRRFGDRTLPPSSGGKPTQLRSISEANLHLRTQKPTQGKICKPNTT